jgi:ornithine decarboxylase
MLPGRIARSVKLWRKELPKVTPFYAVKCNPELQLLKLLSESGIFFDCASKRELKEVHAIAPSSEIIYANPCKSKSDIAAAQGLGSPLTVIDSAEEIDKLGSYSGGALLRIAVDDSKSDMPFSSKFGAPMGAIGPIARYAAKRKFPIHGFSFHVGSGSRSATSFSDAISEALAFMSVLKEAGHTPTVLDIGGGFLADATDFEKKAHHIRKVTAEIPYKLYAEPGRFFATNAFDFYVQVIGKKPAYTTNNVQQGWKYTIDDSIYGQFTNILFDKAKPKWLRVVGKNDTPRAYTKGTLFGRTCDSLDQIATAEVMEELEVGDWLWFPDMGAYTRATASEFNGFPTPPIHVLGEDEEVSNTIHSFSPFLAWGVKYGPGATC